MSDWANWEDDPGAYETMSNVVDHVQTQGKPWFPYSPADANSEDRFSDTEAQVDISDIDIPGERSKGLSAVMWYPCCIAQKAAGWTCLQRSRSV